MEILNATLERLEDENAVGYNIGSSFYDRLYKIDRAFNLAHWQEEQWLVDFVRGVRHNRILDCMCGTGSPSLFLADALCSLKENSLIVGVDNCRLMLSKLRRNARNYGSLCLPPSTPISVSGWSWTNGYETGTVKTEQPEMKVLQTDVHRLRQHFPPNFFDVVIVWGCSIQHLLTAQCWHIFLKDIQTILNPKGYLVFNTLCYLLMENGDVEEVDEEKRMYRGSSHHGHTREHFLIVSDYYACRIVDSGVIQRKTAIAMTERAGSVQRFRSASVWLNPLDKVSIHNYLLSAGFDEISTNQPRIVTQNWIAKRSKVNG